ncbi:MAG: hypothetical protein KGD63_07305 [Candidatus Lokiarchaeota archaeon]|nr:hypothetical protein [Candidatus Lokiarchaeota archaeon]
MDPINIEDLEAFINGLKVSFDSLEHIQTNNSQGVQAQVAKAISQLRAKKLDKIEPLPRLLGHITKEDLKNLFLNRLEKLKYILESNNYPKSRKFNLVMKIVKLREKVNSF